jgi:hypothetical protein
MGAVWPSHERRGRGLKQTRDNRHSGPSGLRPACREGTAAAESRPLRRPSLQGLAQELGHRSADDMHQSEKNAAEIRPVVAPLTAIRKNLSQVAISTPIDFAPIQKVQFLR